MKKVMIIGCAGAGQRLAIEKALIAENKEPIFVRSIDEIPEDVNAEIMSANAIKTEAIKIKRLAEIPKCYTEAFNKPKRKGHERPYKFHP